MLIRIAKIKDRVSSLLDETFPTGLGDWESDIDVGNTSDGPTRIDEWFPTMEWRASFA